MCYDYFFSKAPLQMESSVLLEEQDHGMAELRSIMMVNGAPGVMTTSDKKKQIWCADNWDTCTWFLKLEQSFLVNSD